jgi:hypothetical protein
MRIVRRFKFHTITIAQKYLYIKNTYSHIDILRTVLLIQNCNNLPIRVNYFRVILFLWYCCSRRMKRLICYFVVLLYYNFITRFIALFHWGNCTVQGILFVATNFRGFYKMQWFLGSWICGFKHYRQPSTGKLYFVRTPRFSMISQYSITICHYIVSWRGHICQFI